MTALLAETPGAITMFAVAPLASVTGFLGALGIKRERFTGAVAPVIALALLALLPDDLGAEAGAVLFATVLVFMGATIGALWLVLASWVAAVRSWLRSG